MRTPDGLAIEYVLGEIEKAYLGSLSQNTERFCKNIFNNFGVDIPPRDRMTVREVSKFIYEKYHNFEINILNTGALEFGSNNIVNPQVGMTGAILAGNTRVNLSRNNYGNAYLTPGTFVKDCELIDSKLEGVIIEGGSFTKITGSQIKEGTVLFGGAKIRDSVIGEWNEIGQIEIVRSTTGKLIKALHRGFLGDAELGDNINVSNFFGIMNSSHEGVKAKVKIGNNVFLGGRSAIISGEKGITIGDDAVIAGGAVVLKDVPEGYIYINKDKAYPKRSKKE